MLVYGDHAERVDPRERLREIADRLARPQLSHDELVWAFVELSGVAQGVADADFGGAGCDRVRPAEAQLLASLTNLAQLLATSWDRNRSGVEAPVDLKIPTDLPAEISVRLPEGYAFYALRPEAYLLAARQLRLTAPPQIIGLRSIGSGLACMAAAALNAPPPTAVRPTGDPFNRELSIDPHLEGELLAGEAHYVIVDEGPGMSGSSFGCVADWLEERGIPPERVAFLPSHAHPLGPEASQRHRDRWSGAQRPVVTLDQPDQAELEAVIGPITAPLADLSGGAWRPLRNPAEHQWPAIDPTWERRKFLARSAEGSWLVKWAGLGSIGERKLALADQLRDWVPEVAGFAGGWLVTRWYDDARPTRPTMDDLAAYLHRRSTIPARGSGASLELLTTMVRRNVPALADWNPDLTHLEPRYCCTDNRMAAHEWLRRHDGRLLKADALDHHQSHDLIGCQDIAWDVAGAAVELDMPPADTEHLREVLGIEPPLLAFTLVAYRAFRIGAHRMSAATLSHWPAEQRRNLQAADRVESGLPAVNAIEHASHVD